MVQKLIMYILLKETTYKNKIKQIGRKKWLPTKKYYY